MGSVIITYNLINICAWLLNHHPSQNVVLSLDSMLVLAMKVHKRVDIIGSWNVWCKNSKSQASLSLHHSTILCVFDLQMMTSHLSTWQLSMPSFSDCVSPNSYKNVCQSKRTPRPSAFQQSQRAGSWDGFLSGSPSPSPPPHSLVTSCLCQESLLSHGLNSHSQNNQTDTSMHTADSTYNKQITAQACCGLPTIHPFAGQETSPFMSAHLLAGSQKSKNGHCNVQNGLAKLGFVRPTGWDTKTCWQCRKVE